MIFVVTGFHNLQFDRLVKAMDNYAATTNEPVIIQKGCSGAVIEHAVAFDYGTSDTMASYFQSARLVVSHAGVGTIIDARRHQKPLIVVPRMKELKEAFDNHQLEIASALDSSGTAIMVKNVASLPTDIARISGNQTTIYSVGKKKLIDSLRLTIAEIEGRNTR